MPCSLISAPPTLNTMTATHAIQPILSINENVYKVKILMKYSVYFFRLNVSIWNNIKYNR